jgi:hypothetical protein
MATVTTGYTFVNNETVTPAKLNSLAGGASVSNIVDSDVSSSAAIADTKLATIFTAGKVSNSATTATSANTANAIVARDASGNFTAGTITAGTITAASFSGPLAGNVIGNLTGTASAIADGAVSTTAKLANSIVTPAKMTQWLTSGTAQATTSGTSVDFTGIPSWAKRITVMFNGVSTAAVVGGSSNILIQIGSSTISTSGYNSGASYASTSGTWITSTTGFVAIPNGMLFAAALYCGSLIISLISNNAWVTQGSIYSTTGTVVSSVGGVSPSLSGALDRIRITTLGGTDTFDAGSVNIMYEG